MIAVCWAGIHQWRVSYYSTIVDNRMRLVQVVSCARCGLVRSRGHV